MRGFADTRQSAAGTPAPVTHCPFCGVQCALVPVTGAAQGATGMRAAKGHSAAGGKVCQKGLLTDAASMDHGRIREAWLRTEGGFAGLTTAGALDWTAAAIGGLQKRFGKAAMAVFGSGALLNEEAYLLGKFARVAMRTSSRCSAQTFPSVSPLSHSTLQRPDGAGAGWSLWIRAGRTRRQRRRAGRCESGSVGVCVVVTVILFALAGRSRSARQACGAQLWRQPRPNEDGLPAVSGEVVHFLRDGCPGLGDRSFERVSDRDQAYDVVTLRDPQDLPAARRIAK